MRKDTFQIYAANRGVTVLMLTLITTFTFVSGVILAPHLIDAALATEQPTQSSEAPSEDEILTVYDNALIKIYEKTVPSVVKLEITRPDPHAEPGRGYGSGFVWDNAGHIVTNFHVVREAEQITVTFVDGTSLAAELWGTDPFVDLAVLKVESPPGDLQPVTLGESAGLKVGQLALAIGSPFGQEFTMTRGVISGVGRIIRTCESCYPIPNTIQMDTPINPGNSGGPLFNQRGEVIGITTMMISRSDSNTGVSFAITIDTAKQTVPYLINSKLVAQ